MNRGYNWLDLCFEVVSDFVSQETPRDKINKKYRYVAEHILSVLSYMKNVSSEETRDDIAIIYYILGYVYSDVLFNLDMSLDLYFKALKLYDTLPSTEPTTLAALYCNIAATYSDKGKYSEAAQWHHKALKIREEIFGAEDEETAKSYHNIAGMYFNMRDLENAMSWGNKALSIREKVIGDNHYDTALTLHLLADIHYENNEESIALSLYERALDIFVRQIGLPSGIVSIGHAETEDNVLYDAALKSCINTLEITKAEIGDNNTIIAGVYNHIAFLYSERKEYDNALEYYLKTLELHENILGFEHNHTAEDYNNIGEIYYLQGQLEEGLRYSLKAISIFEKILGNKHPDTISAYVNIAMIYTDIGNDEMAQIYYNKSKAIK